MVVLGLLDEEESRAIAVQIRLTSLFMVALLALPPVEIQAAAAGTTLGGTCLRMPMISFSARAG